MKTQTLYPIVLALALAPITFTTAVLSQPSSSSWLERKPLTNWNRPTASIPKAPNREFTNAERCKQQIRNPSTPEERAVNVAGWTITKGRGRLASMECADPSNTSNLFSLKECLLAQFPQI
jgi:hypothetical protein